jgi:acid phosphatase (class A)
MRQLQWAAGAAAVVVAGTALAQTAAPIPYPGWSPGYLSLEALRSVSALPPPPPDPAPDRAFYERTRALKDTPRWALAAADVPLDRQSPARTFACALGRPMPEPVVALLDRVKTDAGLATDPAKRQYARTRPFGGEAQPRTCTVMTPDQTARSYPSGHAAIGWAWGLVLAELAPDRADPILRRARAFGDSRAVCGVHYPSDVAGGRDVAAATVARLHADPAFRADLERARAALAAAAPSDEPAPACAAEAQAITQPLG